jgi:hypothetical protein
MIVKDSFLAKDPNRIGASILRDHVALECPADFLDLLREWMAECDNSEGPGTQQADASL